MTKLSEARMRELTQALRDAGRLRLAPGVIDIDGERVLEVGPAYIDTARPMMASIFTHNDLSGAVLDFNDDATVGVLAGQARELWGDPDMYCRALSLGGQWTVYRFDRSGMPHVFTAETEAEAWVGAILRAPGRDGL